MEFLGWIGDIADLVGAFIPRWRWMPAGDEAVRITRGSKRIVIRSGDFYIYWPWLHELYQRTVVRQVSELDEQILTTKDGTTVGVQGTIAYRITDIEKHQLENEDADSSILDIAATSVLDHVQGHDFTFLLGVQPPREVSELTKAARRDLARFGAAVEYVRLRQFAKTESRAHFGLTRPLIEADEE